MDGTSAASPIVTGIIALLLQMNPQLDAAQAKRILQQSARADGFTGATPNTQWGYGKVDAYAALGGRAGHSAAAVGLSAGGPSRWWLPSNRPTPGRHYVLEASSDLLGWSAVLTNTATGNLLELLNSAATRPQRFYRVIQLAP